MLFLQSMHYKVSACVAEVANEISCYDGEILLPTFLSIAPC